MEILCNTSNPPIGGLAACEFVKGFKFPVKITWGTKSVVTFKDGVSKPYETQNDILRILAREVKDANLYGTTPLEQISVDHWLSFSLTLHNCLPDKIKYLDDVLAHLTFLVSNCLTIADLAVCSVLNGSQSYATLLKKSYPTNVVRWMKLINSQQCIMNALNSLPKEVLDQLNSKNDSNSSEKVGNNKSTEPGGRLQEGKFVDLPGAEMGKVIVRFPPEASGYLHIGHAKAALLNQYYQQAFDGKLIMRFDDTNPAKENVHFEKVILEDVEMLDIKPDIFTHTSQYFDMMLEMCERLIKQQKAFVDDTLPEQMKNEREQKVNSSNRDNSVDKNLKLWEEMKAGSEIGIKCCVRAKIDMQSPNGCMRDPTIYRCKPEPHPRTGTQYKVYPTYDFACPIVDAVEGVTHVLRTMEYHDRDPQFYWFIEALELRRPYIWEYSRLSMTNTVLSKRKLTWFVEEGLVDGWDDPRFPTVRGVLRRGMTVEGLKQFIIAQGSSRSVVFMEWDKIWSFNKKVIDPIAPRYTALEVSPTPVVVNVKNITKEEALTIPCHPKNAAVGNKTVWVGPKVLIDQADAQLLKEGENATFINWGNIKIEKIYRSADGSVASVDANTNLDDKDYKKTLKLTWLADVSADSFTPTFCVFFENIISKPVLAKDDDFKKYIGHTTRTEIEMAGDPELKKLKTGVTIQLQRRGFFRVDVAYQPSTEICGRCQPCVLFHIPDGHTKEQPTLQQSKTIKEKTPPIVKASPAEKVSGNAEGALLESIAKQGDKVRLLKEQKADKAAVTAEVQGLLALKAEYKKLTGADWTPNSKPPSAQPAVVQNNAPTESGGANAVLDKIAQQGDKIRQLKQQKADKKAIEPEVQSLLALKAEYKKLTGSDWTPDTKKSAQPAPVPKEPSPSSGGANAILDKIGQQGDKIRLLKQDKADKKVIEVEVKTLLALKADYKKATGVDWTPNTKPSGPSTPVVASISPPKIVSPAMAASPPSQSGDSSLDGILDKITQQGDKIRQLKQDKADKKALDPEIQALLALKAEYKKVSGKDWTPNVTPAKAPQPTKAPAKPQVANDAAKAAQPGNPMTDALTARINDQGNVVRNLKSNKEEKKEVVDAAVKLLLQLKAEYKTLTGTDFPVPGKVAKPAASKPTPAKKEKTPPADAAKMKSKKPEAGGKDDKELGGLKKQTRLGLEACKETDLSDWYSQVITKGEMIEYYDVSGCYILRPWSYAIWDVIKDFLSTEIKKLGVKDCYFPIFVSKAALEREKTHIADFAPEVAWVTRSGETELAEHIAVRPTSETVMYPAYAKWIQSYRDLPLRLNQWNNVVRWEFQHPQPFLRSREFLWQEGHTAFATKPPADEEVLQILDLYAKVYTDLLAIPVIPGRKTEKEKFAGGDYTTTVEAFVPASGRGIQGATSHHLGQNFAKMFEIIYDDPETQEKRYVFQNSWGLTTRTIGVMVMVHGDNQGLVLPPRVAAVQAVIVPCGVTATTSAEDKKKLLDSCEQLESSIAAATVRVQGDYRDNYSPGWKFNHWELKGVPIRIELGPKDMAQGQLVAVRRDTGDKIIIKRETAVQDIVNLLNTIHSDMLAKATAERDSHMKLVTSWDDFNTALDGKNIIQAPYCGREPCEDAIKRESARTEVEGDASEAGKLPAMGAKALCIPFLQPRPLQMQDKCIHPACSEKPKFFTLFGRSY